MRALLFVTLIVWLISGLSLTAQADFQYASVVDENEVQFTTIINNSDFFVGDTLKIWQAAHNLGDEYVEYPYWVFCRYTIQAMIFEGECDWQVGNCPADWVEAMMPWPTYTWTCTHTFDPGEADTTDHPFTFVFLADFSPGVYTVAEGLTDIPGPLTQDDFLVDTVASLQFNYWGNATGVAELPKSWGTIKALFRAR